ncbi:unnamed protein product [Rotaria magnacalcarata]|uniref:Uncharacterized protein n=1 Tax=Rotaria magnacalcarata TaxID=392030 RepID=A0A816ACA3_9BILA|nr:unnamed protein product [Rotaria magnacalcarata]CAF3753735.1 unnamed protein product [Rotaria magnacalcarata]
MKFTTCLYENDQRSNNGRDSVGDKFIVVKGGFFIFVVVLSFIIITGRGIFNGTCGVTIEEAYGLLINDQPDYSLLWNFRTVDFNYICMTPLIFAENLDELIKNRLNPFDYQLTILLWSHEFHIMGGEISRDKNNIQLTDYQTNLILGID